ncbi:MAG: PTS sugar transporter subunit IIC [Gemmatimonadales bacterium]|jgi:PTS system mannose-specific IIC component
MGEMGWLVVWGTLVGLDLATVGQVMISRPLVAGTVAGCILGDPVAGAMAGAILELFALEVLPVGASRYPDYGLGAVAAAAAGANSPGTIGLGVAVFLGLIVASVGGAGMTLVRRRTTDDVRRHREALEVGDTAAVRGIQLRGLGRDLLRSSAVTAFGLAFGKLVYFLHPVATVGGAVLISVVVIGSALGVATQGLLRATGRGGALGWFALGLAGGALWVVVT